MHCAQVIPFLICPPHVLLLQRILLPNSINSSRDPHFHLVPKPYDHRIHLIVDSDACSLILLWRENAIEESEGGEMDG